MPEPDKLEGQGLTMEVKPSQDLSIQRFCNFIYKVQIEAEKPATNKIS